MELKNKETFVDKLLKQNKIILFISLLLTAIVDIAVLIILCVQKFSFVYLICPIILVVFDAFYLFVFFNTNYKFKYSKYGMIIYDILIAISVAVTSFINIGLKQSTIMTFTAFIFMIVFHIISLLVINLSRLTIVKKEKSSIVPKVALIAGMVIICSIYGYSLSDIGYFGQGNVTRTISYSLNDDNTYKVTSVINGRGNKISIPATYNGKVVSSVSYDLFLDSSIKTIDISKRESKLDFVDFDSENEYYNDIILEVSKDDIADIENDLYSDFLTYDKYSLLPLCNNVIPNDLSDDEVYLTFEFTEDILKITKDEFIPTQVFKKNTNLSFASLSEYSFVSHNDKSDELDLVWNYENNNKYIVSDLTADNKSLISTNINKNISLAKFSFEDIYQVEITEDNDTVYSLPLNERYTLNDDEVYRNYKYCTLDQADSLIDNITKRDGFTFTFTSNGTTQTSLKTLLETNGNKVTTTVTPNWTLNTLSSVELSNDLLKWNLTYGESVIVSLVKSQHDIEDYIVYTYTYNIYKDGSLYKTYTLESSSLSLDPTILNAYGDYKIVLDLTIKAPSISSLFSSMTNINNTISLSKKTVTITYSDPSSFVYDGTIKEVGAIISSDQQVLSDDLTLVSANNANKNVGTYNIVFSFSDSSLNDKYILANNTHTITISKKVIDVIWSTNEFTYTGSAISIPYSFNDGAICNGDTLGESIKLENGDDVIHANTDINPFYTVKFYITNTNYEISSTTLTYQITVKALELSIAYPNVHEYTYNATNQKPNITFTNQVSSDDLKVTYHYYIYGESDTDYTGSPIYVGSYVLTKPDILNTDYHLGSFEEFSFSITKLDVTITWGNTAFTYNGKVQKPTFTLSLTNLDSKNTALTKDELSSHILFEGDNAVKNYKDGNYSIAAYVDNTCNFANCYSLTSSTCDFTIAKKDISISWSNTTKTYNGLVQSPNVSSAGLYSTDDVIIKVNGFKNAGSYTATSYLDGEDKDNYNIKNYETHDFTINKKALTITWSNTELTYNGSYQNPTATVNNICADEDGSYDDFELIYPTGNQKVGSYTCQLTIDSSYLANYTIDSSYLSKTYRINAKQVNLTWSNTEVTYDGNYHIASASTSDFIDGNDVYITVATSNGSTVGYYTAGAHSLVASLAGSDANNYTIVENTATLTIDKKVIDLVWSNDTYTYDGNSHTCSVTCDGFASRDNKVTITSTSYTTAGLHVVTASLSGSGYTNYKISESTSTHTLTINTKKITITWGNTTVTYNGKCQTISGNSFSGKISGDDVDVSYSNSSSKKVGTYTIKASLNGDDYSNYEISNPTEELTIEKKSVTITWGDTSVTYNGKTQTINGNSSSDLISGDDVTITTDYSSSKNVGTYAIKASLIGDDAINYKLINDSNELKITPKTTTITWGSDSLTYNGQTQTISGNKLTDLISGDDIIITTDYCSSKNVGTYTITATISGDDALNYSVSTLTHTLTITKKSITITWGNDSLTYNGEIQTISGNTYTGNLSGDDVSVSYSYSSSKNVGNYTITASLSGAEANNYTISNSTHTLTITAKVITITWGNDSLTYNGEIQTISGNTYTGVISGDDVSVTYSNSSSKDVGNYTITASLSGADASNYTISNSTHTLTITAKAITITWGNDSLTYNGETQTITYNTFSGALAGDYVNVTYSNSSSKDVGTYTIEASLTGTDAKNYIITNSQHTLTITPKEVTITYSNTDIDYDGNSHSPSYTINGLITGDSLNETTSGGDQTQEDTYTFTITSNNDNYVIKDGDESTIYTIEEKDGD